MNEIQRQLLNEAKEATSFSYAPYSKFRVGAAVLADQKIFHGANIENASSSLGTCAERVAIAHARMNGATHIEGIAIYCEDGRRDSEGKYLAEESMPCGGCLQWISELAPDAWIITNGLEAAVSISDLLPKAFKLPK